MARSRRPLYTVIGVIAAFALIAAAIWQYAWSTSKLVPDQGGVYIEAVAGQPNLINPLLAHFNGTDQELSALVFSGLTKASADGAIVPDLATGWDISSDGLNYTFRLDPSRKWHDGQPLKADDVIYTVATLQDPDFPGLPDLARQWQGVKTSKVDDLTVRFTLPAPNAPFLGQTRLGLLPSHLLANVKAADLASHLFNANPVGSGPFRVTAASVEQVSLAPDPAHPAAKPLLESLVFRFYPSSSAAVAGLMRGEAQGVRSVPIAELSALSGNADYRVTSGPNYGRASLLFINTNRAPLSNAQVRKAISLSLDRQRLIDEVVAGNGYPAYGPLPPNNWAFDGASKAAPDLVEAKRLLDAAGLRDSNNDGWREFEGKPVSLKLSTSNAEDRVRLAAAIVAQLQPLGLRVESETLSWDDLRDNRLVPRRYDLALAETLQTDFDPDVSAFWHSRYAEEGINFSAWQNAQADAVLQRGRETTAQAQRQVAYVEFQKLFASEAPAIFLYYPRTNYVQSAAVKGVQFASVMAPEDRFRNFADWYMREKRVFFQ